MEAKDRVFMQCDSSGRLHAVKAGPCDGCGCAYQYSLDEPGVVWESGDVIMPGCRDLMCDCHILPLRGERVSLHFAS